MYRHILIPTDGSPLSLKAARAGSKLAKHLNAKVTALYVIPPFVLHGMKGIGTEPAYLINVPTYSYVYDEPDEFRMDPHSPDVPYDWGRKDG